MQNGGNIPKTTGLPTLQGWGVLDEQRAEEKLRSGAAGVAGFLPPGLLFPPSAPELQGSAPYTQPRPSSVWP